SRGLHHNHFLAFLFFRPSPRTLPGIGQRPKIYRGKNLPGRIVLSVLLVFRILVPTLGCNPAACYRLAFHPPITGRCSYWLSLLHGRGLFVTGIRLRPPP